MCVCGEREREGEREGEGEGDLWVGEMLIPSKRDHVTKHHLVSETYSVVKQRKAWPLTVALPLHCHGTQSPYPCLGGV